MANYDATGTVYYYISLFFYPVCSGEIFLTTKNGSAGFLHHLKPLKQSG